MKLSLTTLLSCSALLTLSALGLACSPEPEETEAAGERDDGLVGGIPTSDRPEVGMFINPQGGRCTAVLLRPDVVLTASHCLPEPFTSGGAITAMKGDGFGRFYPWIGKSYGGHAVYAYRAFSVTSAKRQWIADGNEVVGPKDIALLWLSTPVSAQTATPAVLADRWPDAGESVTVYGFGCDDRETGDGGGTKRSFTFGYGPSEVLCPGDSGGPVVLGSGAIFAVNSGHSTTTGQDIFGDVVALRSAIEQKLKEGPVAGKQSSGTIIGDPKPR